MFMYITISSCHMNVRLFEISMFKPKGAVHDKIIGLQQGKK